MTVPFDAIRAIHNAFRTDIAAIDEAANAAAHGKGGLNPVIQRYKFLNDILVWHADGEEEFVFPAVEKVAPLISEPYEKDHRGLDSLYGRLDKNISAGDPIETARSTAALSFHLNIHLDKEEAHLYRVFNERIPIQEQGKIASGMSQKIPPDRFPQTVGWLFPLVGIDDRENLVRIWQQAMPAPVFTRAVGLIQTAISDDWGDLLQRVPELGSAGKS